MTICLVPSWEQFKVVLNVVRCRGVKPGPTFFCESRGRKKGLFPVRVHLSDFHVGKEGKGKVKGRKKMAKKTLELRYFVFLK